MEYWHGLVTGASLAVAAIVHTAAAKPKQQRMGTLVNRGNVRQ